CSVSRALRAHESKGLSAPVRTRDGKLSLTILSRAEEKSPHPAARENHELKPSAPPTGSFRIPPSAHDRRPAISSSWESRSGGCARPGRVTRADALSSAKRVKDRFGLLNESKATAHFEKAITYASALSRRAPDTFM